MAEASKGRVTITLGRTGQVVKRAAASVSDIEYGDYCMEGGAGRKRSVRDRLGSNSDSFSSRTGTLTNNKRHRGESYPMRVNSNGVEDARVGKDDLRLKLMQKSLSRRAPYNYDQKTMDLREKLSRTVHPPGPSLTTVDTRQRMPGPKEPSSILGRIPPTRSADDLPRMESSRDSYSPWTLDHIRRRSPDRIIGSSRGLSPRKVEEIQRRPSNRAFDDARPVPYMKKDILDAQRPVSSSTAFMAKPVMPTASTKPAAPILGQLPPPSGILQKNLYAGEEQQTVESLLHSLGLGKYAILFKAEEVDMTALKQMGETDLKELGIPMGPRKKILLALLPRSKRQP